MESDKLIPLIKIDWYRYKRRFKNGMLKKRAELSRYLADHLAPNIASEPSEISLRVVQASKNRVYLKGVIHRGPESDRVEADIVWGITRSHSPWATALAWLFRQKNFKGLVRINPPADYATKKEDYERYITFYKYYFNLALRANGFFYAIIGGILSIFLTKDVPKENATITAFCILIAVLMSFAFGGLFIYGSILWGRVRWGMNVVRSELNIERNLDVHILTIALRMFGAIFIFVGIVMSLLAATFFYRNR